MFFLSHARDLLINYIFQRIQILRGSNWSKILILWEI